MSSEPAVLGSVQGECLQRFGERYLLLLPGLSSWSVGRTNDISFAYSGVLCGIVSTVVCSLSVALSCRGV